MADSTVAPRRVLIVTHELLRANVSGPGARVLEMGAALSDTLRVTIATPCQPEIEVPGCTLAAYAFGDGSALRRLVVQADVLVVQGFTLDRFPWLRHLDIPLVVDLYCPFTLEHLEMTRRAIQVTQTRRLADVLPEAAGILLVQNEQLGDGDFFMCATERQLDFWLGALHTAGRINPHTYGDDPTLRRLIDVVPFGIAPPLPASAARPPSPLKGRHPGIRTTDKVLLWGGLMGDWQDPQSVVRSVAALSRERDDVKLFFMATKHPNPQVAPMRALEECRTLARELGVMDTHVFFNDWVPYRELPGYLFDADIGLSTHGDHLETRFSFRARMRDYVWAALPVVCTRGDYFGDLVEARGLGLTVPPHDVDALTRAIRTLLEDDELRRRCRANFGSVAEELRWTRVVEPLRRFCAEPRFAADRIPEVRPTRRRLAQGVRRSKGIKRALLRLGVPEALLTRTRR